MRTRVSGPCLVASGLVAAIMAAILISASRTIAQTAMVPSMSQSHPTGILTVTASQGSVDFKFVVRNTTKSTLHYDFPTSQQFDINVTDPHGGSVWRWSTGRRFSQLITSFSLNPGEQKVYTARWNTGVPSSGSYVADATLIPAVHPAIRGGVVFDPDRDPDNVGMTTNHSIQSGNVVAVNVTPQVTGETRFEIGH